MIILIKKNLLDNDIYFEESLKECLKTKEITDSINLTYNFLFIALDKINEKSGSSGSLNYSLLKILYEIVLNESLNIWKKTEKKYKLVIDEIEKFSHPEMIFKISEMVTKISEKFDVILTTHSPLFLERIFYLHKRCLKNNKNLKIKYLIKNKIDENEPFELDNQIICEKIKKENYRFLSNFSKILFSSNVFLVEGLLENSLINEIIINSDDLKESYYTIIDCNGKNDLKKIYKFLNDLGIADFYKICLVYDLDEKKESIKINSEKIENKKVFSIVSDPFLEKEFFEVENKIIKFKRNKEKKLEKFKKEDDFIFSTDFIRNNSTKDVDKKIENWKKTIKEFLLSKCD